jgi:hypothetical protein
MAGEDGAAGGRVERTGIALVHEGEEIRPAPGAEAVIGPPVARAGDDRAVHMYFPVEVHVAGGIPEAERRELEQRIWSALDGALS